MEKFEGRKPVKVAGGKMLRIYRDEPLSEFDFSMIPKIYKMSFSLDGIWYECSADKLEKLRPLADKVRANGGQVNTWVICRQDVHEDVYKPIKTPW